MTELDIEIEAEIAEAEQVVRHRAREARRLGCSLLEARTFAASGGDLGLLRKLVEQGCSPQLALRIAS